MKEGFPSISTEKLPFTEANHSVVRLKPFFDRFMLELVYEKEIPVIKVREEKEVLGLDLGVNNLVATSDGLLIKAELSSRSINSSTNKKQRCKYN